MNTPPKSPATRTLRNFLIGLAVFLLYAYAIEVTQVNLREPLEAQRQENLVGVVRMLARPDIFEYDDEIRTTSISVRMPCPEEIKGSQVSIEGRVALLAPNCATTTQDVLTLTGTGFQPNVGGIVRWYPPGATATTRQLTSFKADAQGNFTVQFTMPDIRPTEETQQIEIREVLSRQIVGFSEASHITWERIIETILMALIASTLGTILAVPISFVAARNLMASVSLPLAAVMGAVVAFPLGGWLGREAGTWMIELAGQLGNVGGAVAWVMAMAVLWGVLRFGWEIGGRVVAFGRFLLAALLFFFSLSLLGQLGIGLGAWLEPRLGVLGFLGNFVVVLSDLTVLTLPLLLALVAGAVLASFGSHYGQEAVLRLPETPARLLTGTLAGLGTAVSLYSFGLLLNWFYQFETPAYWTTYPAVVGGVVAGIAGGVVAAKRPFAIGLVVYNLSRGVLNTLRAIEPIIMGIIFVVWVGLGPFAGIMALMLHSIADLGKLFSEQVENIDQGPLEAITATGANRLQTIVYAVIPQVIPPYIAFTFYRWDINVRMSTVIGFVGGGGIGFVLQQNINLLRYRQASVMVIAIAVVVAVLDYVSAKIRSRII